VQKRLVLDLHVFTGEKTEKATPQKRQEAKRKGQVAKSPEVAAAMIMLGGVLLLYFTGGWMLDQILAMFRINLTQFFNWDLTPASTRTLLEQMAFEGLKIMVPMALIGMIFGFFGNYIQIGPIFSTDPLMVKLERIDPIKGAKRIFSVRALVELAKSLLKISDHWNCRFPRSMGVERRIVFIVPAKCAACLELCRRTGRQTGTDRFDHSAMPGGAGLYLSEIRVRKRNKDVETGHQRRGQKIGR